MAAQRLDVGGKVEGDQTGFLGHLGDQRFTVVVTAQTFEGIVRLGEVARAGLSSGQETTIRSLA